jgi:hypothetical protein
VGLPQSVDTPRRVGVGGRRRVPPGRPGRNRAASGINPSVVSELDCLPSLVRRARWVFAELAWSSLIGQRAHRWFGDAAPRPAGEQPITTRQASKPVLDASRSLRRATPTRSTPSRSRTWRSAGGFCYGLVRSGVPPSAVPVWGLAWAWSWASSSR